jgi:hypothetical protein
MKTKHARLVGVAACLSAAVVAPAQAGTEQRLGRIMALPIMAKFCHLSLTSEQSADIDKFGMKLQQEVGLSNDQMKDVSRQLLAGLKSEDCVGIQAHWTDSVATVIDQERSEQ